MNEQAKYYEAKLEYEIDSWDLKSALDGGERIVVVDARSLESFCRGHVPGATNIPHRTMSVETTAHIEESALVVVYCDGIGCNASTKGALKMLNLGFRVKELIGGLDWWQRDGHPVHANTPLDNTATCGCA